MKQFWTTDNSPKNNRQQGIWRMREEQKFLHLVLTTVCLLAFAGPVKSSLIKFQIYFCLCKIYLLEKKNTEKCLNASALWRIQWAPLRTREIILYLAYSRKTYSNQLSCSIPVLCICKIVVCCKIFVSWIVSWIYWISIIPKFIS